MAKRRSGPVRDSPSGRDAAWGGFCWLTIRNNHDTFKQMFIEYLFNEKGSVIWIHVKNKKSVEGKKLYIPL